MMIRVNYVATVVVIVAIVVDVARMGRDIIIRLNIIVIVIILSV